MSVTIGQVRDDYYRATETLSKLTRSLTFSGVAIVWIFTKTTETGKAIIPTLMLIGLFMFVLSLLSDLLQYAYKSLMLKYVLEDSFEEKKDYDAEAIYPKRKNITSRVLFVLKILFMIAGYILLGIEILMKILS